MLAQRINLVPPEERRKALRERGIIYAVLFLVFVAAVLAILSVYENQQLNAPQRQVASLQADLEAVNAQIAALKPYETLESQRATMTQMALQIVDSRVAWSSILEEISLVIPDTVALNGLTAAMPASMVAGSKLNGATTDSTAGDADITFSGQAVSQKDIATFMTRVGLLPQLTNIQLVSTEMETASSDTSADGSSGSALVSFQMTAQLRPFQTSPPLAVPAARTAPTTQTSGQ